MTKFCTKFYISLPGQWIGGEGGLPPTEQVDGVFFRKLDKNMRLAPLPLTLRVSATPAGDLESATVDVSFEPFFRLVHFLK